MLNGGLSNPLYNVYNSPEYLRRMSDEQLLAEYGLDDFKLTENFVTRVGKHQWTKFD